MDLSAAESVMSGVFAESAQELAALEDFRSGSLGNKIKEISKKIEGLLVKVESQLDFSYLTSPSIIEDKIKYLDIKEYHPMDFSKIFLSLSSFEKLQNKFATQENIDEKKSKKE